MPTEIVVPDLGESVVEATIADWLKKEGDYVQAGEAIVVLETDKVDLDVGADRSGVLSEIRAQQGQDVKVGDVIALIDESAQAPDGSGQPEPAKAAAPAAVTPGAPAAPPEAEPVAPPSEPAPAGSAPAASTPAASATPVARRYAQEQGVDLAQVAPASGDRITKEDVERHLAGQRDQPPASQPPAARPTPAEPPRPTMGPPPSVTPALDGRSEERVRMTRRRRTIAERLVEAQHTAAMLTTFNEVDMTAIMALRKRRQDAFVERHGIKLGIASFFVKAAIGALKAFPQVNAEIDGTDIVLKHYYDIGVAIGAEEGLIVPVLRNADRMSFAEVEQAIKDFAQRAQDNTLTLDDLRGGTFTITNGGVFGSLLSTPILNPPQVGILGLHKIEDRPIALNGEVVIRAMMYVALSYDHRIIDGREAVRFLVRIKELIEDPDSLLLEG